MEQNEYTRDPREVVHSYTAPEPESVVLCYVAPTPLPGRKTALHTPAHAEEYPKGQEKSKRRGVRIALIVLAAAFAIGLRALAVMQVADRVQFFFYRSGEAPFSFDDFAAEDFVPPLHEKENETTIPRCDAGGTARLRFTKEHGLSMPLVPEI